jgi:hypothetical protein
MMKKIIITIFFLNIIACEEKQGSCKSIENINFPKDINTMIRSKQICDASSNKWTNTFKLEYDDDNFALLGYNEKIKILIDKSNDLIICIKSNEVNNFEIIYNAKDKFTYGINEIVFLDNNLVPTYSIGKYGLYKYFNDTLNHQIEYCVIDDSKISFESLDYNQILSIHNEVKHKEVNDLNCQIIPYYKSPYSWEL